MASSLKLPQMGYGHKKVGSVEEKGLIEWICVVCVVLYNNLVL